MKDKRRHHNAKANPIQTEMIDREGASQETKGGLFNWFEKNGNRLGNYFFFVFILGCLLYCVISVIYGMINAKRGETLAEPYAGILLELQEKLAALNSASRETDVSGLLIAEEVPDFNSEGIATSSHLTVDGKSMLKLPAGCLSSPDEYPEIVVSWRHYERAYATCTGYCPNGSTLTEPVYEYTVYNLRTGAVLAIDKTSESEVVKIAEKYCAQEN